MDEANKGKKVGITYAVSAGILWGVLPLYWKALMEVSPAELLAHRIVWSLLFVTILLAFRYELGNLKKILKNKKSMKYLFLCAILICANWWLFIWSVSTGHVVDASMGYFINPLLSVVLGMLVLKEKMNAWEYAAIGLAFSGVAFLGIQHGSIPWISLVLASTFALYGLLKKMAAVDSLGGLFFETAILAPIFLIFLAGKQIGGTGVFFTSWRMALLLPISGVATGLPLIWYAKASNRVELSTMGVMLYLSPSITLLIGVFVFGEKFSGAHAISFGLIWAGIIMYTLSKLGVLKRFSRQEKGMTGTADKFL